MKKQISDRLTYEYDKDTGIVYGLGGKPVGSKDKNGHLTLAKSRSQNVFVHRLIFDIMGVGIPEGMVVDHINHNRSDNRWSNLRLVTNGENMKNRTKQSNNTSGVTGVSWHKSTSKWIARINVDGKHIGLGSYVELEDAVQARLEAEETYGFHTNHGKDVA